MRYLAIVQVLGLDDSRDFFLPELRGGNTIRAGMWSITAALDPARPAALEIIRSDQSAVLAVNKRWATVKSKRYDATGADSSILVEILPDREIVQVSADTADWR